MTGVVVADTHLRVLVRRRPCESRDPYSAAWRLGTVAVCCSHHPRKRVIQYAANFQFHHHLSGILDRPPSRTMTEGTTAPSQSTSTPPRSRGAYPSCAVRCAIRNIRGRREC